MHEMNILVTVAVIAGLYISLFLVVEKVFMVQSIILTIKKPAQYRRELLCFR